MDFARSMLCKQSSHVRALAVTAGLTGMSANSEDIFKKRSCADDIIKTRNCSSALRKFIHLGLLFTESILKGEDSILKGEIWGRESFFPLCFVYRERFRPKVT